jgi:hypothetical protein
MQGNSRSQEKGKENMSACHKDCDRECTRKVQGKKSGENNRVLVTMIVAGNLYPSLKLLLKGGGVRAIPSCQKLPFCCVQHSLLSFITLNSPLLVQLHLLKPYSLEMSLCTELTIIFASASYNKFIKSCTACPLSPKFAEKTWWMHDSCYYHLDIWCLFWCDDTIQPLATSEGEIVWHWGCYLARDIECLCTAMWVREDEPVTMVEDVCNKEIWAGRPRKVEIQPWDQDMSPKPDLRQWGIKGEVVECNQELLPSMQKGGLKRPSLMSWKCRRLIQMPHGLGMRILRNGCWMSPGGMGRWRILSQP